MAEIAPLPDDDLAEFAQFFAVVEENMGFVPNSLKTMARNPALLHGFAQLAAGAMGPGATLPRPLLQMVAVVASAASGCRYCQAHTSHVAERLGVSPEKVAALWSYPTSPHFSDAERAALALAQAAAESPGRAGQEEFATARAHFSEREIVEIMGVVGLFGFLNRWNDAMATDLEPRPRAFAEAHLSPVGWEIGKHGGR